MVKLPDPPEFHVYTYGIAFLSVCTPITDPAEIERRANAEHPTGISRPWKIHPQPFKCGKPNPCACDEHPNRKHWLLSC